MISLTEKETHRTIVPLVSSQMSRESLIVENRVFKKPLNEVVTVFLENIDSLMVELHGCRGYLKNGWVN